MPHDKNGNIISVGDIVVIPCKVINTYQTEGEGYCNTTLESLEPMFPTNQPNTFTLNTKQVIKKISGGVVL